MGQYTEEVKAILRREGINMFRKGSEKLEQPVKKRRKGKEKKENNRVEGVVHQVSCKDCEKIFIGETKFTMRKTIEQHKKDVKFGRMNNTIAKHVEESTHQTD